MKLVFTPEAEEQADECDRWWREHRDVQDLFARELAMTKTLLCEAPTIGSVYTTLDGLPVRRVLLRKTRAHLYYSVDDDDGPGEGSRGMGGAERSRPEPVVVVEDGMPMGARSR